MVYNVTLSSLDEAASIKKDVKNVESHLEIIFEHMLKWKYFVKAGQLRGWAISIFRACVDSNELIGVGDNRNSNIYNRAREEVLNAYNGGVAAASSACNMNMEAIDSERILQEFNDLDYLLDLDYILNWLLKESRTKEAMMHARNEYDIFIQKYNKLPRKRKK